MYNNWPWYLKSSNSKISIKSWYGLVRAYGSFINLTKLLSTQTYSSARVRVWAGCLHFPFEPHFNKEADIRDPNPTLISFVSWLGADSWQRQKATKRLELYEWLMSCKANVRIKGRYTAAESPTGEVDAGSKIYLPLGGMTYESRPSCIYICRPFPHRCERRLSNSATQSEAAIFRVRVLWLGFSVQESVAENPTHLNRSATRTRLGATWIYRWLAWFCDQPQRQAQTPQWEPYSAMCNLQSAAQSSTNPILGLCIMKNLHRLIWEWTVLEDRGRGQCQAGSDRPSHSARRPWSRAVISSQTGYGRLELNWGLYSAVKMCRKRVKWLAVDDVVK